MQPKGMAMFQLAFHLPYYVWRDSKNKCACEDPRRDENARPLRKTRDVSFLDWTNTRPSSFLYEAQISCLVAGTDESRWIAYGFVDTYFEAVDEGKETVQSYDEDGQDEDDEGMCADPLTYGTCAADKPIWNPREYFLVVLQTRLRQVKSEWQNVVAKMQGSVREYVSLITSIVWCRSLGSSVARDILTFIPRGEGSISGRR
jgi:hypothetical protein